MTATSATQHRPLPEGVVTFAFTDIEASAALAERLGDRRWFHLVQSHNSIVRWQASNHRGHVVKTQGDGFMLVFARASEALHCSVAIQRALDEQSPADEPVRVRIGLHSGEAIRDEGDFFGRHVIAASRLASKAKGGEILASAALRELVEPHEHELFGESRQLELKGFSQPWQAYEVRWDEELPSAS